MILIHWLRSPHVVKRQRQTTQPCYGSVDTRESIGARPGTVCVISYVFGSSAWTLHKLAVEAVRLMNHFLVVRGMCDNSDSRETLPDGVSAGDSRHLSVGADRLSF